MNEKNSNIKITGRTFPEYLNGKLQKPYNKSSYMSKTSLGKYKRPSKNSKLYKKSKKRIHTRSNFVVVFASKSRCINPHATWGTAGDICTSSVTCCATCKEEPGVQVEFLMQDEVRDDGKMKMEEQKMRSELWVQERMEKQDYMEMLQQTEVEVEWQMVVEIVFDMTAEYQLKKMQRLVKL